MNSQGTVEFLGITGPVRDLPVDADSIFEDAQDLPPEFDESILVGPRPSFNDAVVDAVLDQDVDDSIEAPSRFRNFEGISNLPFGSGSRTPPDTVGDIGTLIVVE